MDQPPPGPAAPPVPAPANRPADRRFGVVLLVSVFLISTCGLVYELLAGTVSTYLLGSSVMQFSLVIGIFLTAMGLGSFLSKYVTGNLLRAFFGVEILVGLVGGCSALVLFVAYALIGTYLPLLIIVSVMVGALAGLEIPLLVRILKRYTTWKAALGNVLALDYLGALAASLLFPLLLVPRLGLIRTSFLFGLINLVVALAGLHLFRGQVRSARGLAVGGGAVGLVLLAGLISAGKTTSLLEDVLYDDPVVYAESTPYQRLVVTRWRNDLRLFIDGNIQFSTVDEFRYHEPLVHPAMSLARTPRDVLLLGAGDGMAAREVLKYASVRRVDLVDLDPAMTRIFSSHPTLVKLNKGSLSDPRLTVHNTDAQKYLEATGRRYDVVIIDLPDPNNEALGKLYSRSFYRLVAQHLQPTGVMVTQATSPFYATAAFWCIVNTLAAATLSSAGGSLYVEPYWASVPSFGEWGFVLASLQPIHPERIRLSVPTRSLTPQTVGRMFAFPKDIGPRKTPVNRLDNQVLVRLYEAGYRRYNQ